LRSVLHTDNSVSSTPAVPFPCLYITST